MFAAVVLSAAGVYSLMSFTAAQRTREIGIRCALGANHGRVARAVLSRELIQVSISTAVGVTMGWIGTGSGLWAQGPGPMVGVVGAMLVMGLSACGLPIRRALRVQPTEALQES